MEGADLLLLPPADLLPPPEELLLSAWEQRRLQALLKGIRAAMQAKLAHAASAGDVQVGYQCVGECGSCLGAGSGGGTCWAWDALAVEAGKLHPDPYSFTYPPLLLGLHVASQAGQLAQAMATCGLS